MKRVAAAGLAPAACLLGLLAPTAHTDGNDRLNPAERAYVVEVEPSGVPVRPPTGVLQAGRWVCDDLHRGIPPEEIIATHFGAFADTWGPPVVDAARHHLCPDTLTGGG